jgi:hypothetical protein
LGSGVRAVQDHARLAIAITIANSSTGMQ